jgi:hypothetical protein
METYPTVADLYNPILDDAETITEDAYLLSGVYRRPDGTVYYAGRLDCPDCGCPVVIIHQAAEGKSVECAECGLTSE